MRKLILSGIILAGVAGHAAAMDLNYYTQSGIVGTLVERHGVDCCIGGQEKKVAFPALLLDQPVNVTTSTPQGPDDDPPEQGVRLIQLALKDHDQWQVFRENKGKRVRVACSLFHSANGHHQTPVLCDVIMINRPNQY